MSLDLALCIWSDQYDLNDVVIRFSTVHLRDLYDHGGVVVRSNHVYHD